MPLTKPPPAVQVPKNKELYLQRFRLEDKHTELLQARPEESQDILPFQMCAPRLYVYVKCRCVAEHHCTVGQSFQHGQRHICTYNTPPEPHEIDSRFRGLCPSCREPLLVDDSLTESHARPIVDKTVKDGNKTSRWRRLREVFVREVNMHEYPDGEWTSSIGSHRLRKCHCEECKLKDRLLKVEIEADELKEKLERIQAREAEDVSLLRHERLGR